MLVQLAQRFARSTAQRHLLFLVATLLTVSFIGYHYGTFDQSIHIPFLKKYVDTALFPNDAFFEMRHQHYSYFWFVFQPVYANFGETVLQAVVFAAHLVVTYLTFWTLWILAETLFQTPLASFLAIVAFTVPHLGFAGFPIIEFSLLNRTFALPFMLIALILHLRGQTFWALSLLGVMFNFHVLSVQFVLPLILLDSVLRWRAVNLIKVGLGLAVFGLGALPVLIWKFTGPSIDFSVRAEWFDIVSRGMFAHLFFLLAPYIHIPIITLCGLSALALFFIGRRPLPASPHNAATRHFIWAVLIVIGVQSLLMLFYPITILAQSQVMRIGMYITIFGYLYFAKFMADQYVAPTTNIADWALLAAAGFLSPLPPVPVAVWGVQQLIKNLQWQRLAASAVLTVLMVGSFVVPMRYDVWGPGYQVFPTLWPTPWVDMQLHAQACTPKDAVFITPPDIWWFYTPDWRVFSERSTVVTLSELLEIALVPDNASIWKERFNDLAPGALAKFNGNFYDGRAFTHQAFYTLSQADMERLAAKYRATYLVVQKPQVYPGFPVDYENQEFTMYILPGGQPCAPEETSDQ